MARKSEGRNRKIENREREEESVKGDIEIYIVCGHLCERRDKDKEECERERKTKKGIEKVMEREGEREREREREGERERVRD